jgi:diaminopimelate epimerase
MIGTYGHGTENDFVLVYDPENQIDFKSEQVARICNRQSGIGSDGLIRIGKKDGKWFMDYRNNDGSLAEMCGNGVRVMARYLIDRGYQNGSIFSIDTRAGMKYLSVLPDGNISVNLGKIEAIDGEIEVAANGHKWSGGVNVDVGNPHAVVFVDSVEDAGDLKIAPTVSPASEYPDGVNVEFVELLPNGELKMRVHERGVGETKSCGTGTCAVALAATIKSKKSFPSKWVIHPPGGTLQVEIDAHNNAILTGPAVLIKDCELDSYL